MKGFRIACLIFVFWTLGCATSSLSPTEIPADPIAILYHPGEMARQLAEWRQKLRQEQNPNRAGVARVSDLARMFGGSAFPDPEKLLGYPSFVDARDGKVQRIEQLPRGARPCSRSVDGQRWIFVHDRSGTPQLVRLDRESDEVERLSLGVGAHLFASEAHDGRIAWTVTERSGAQADARVHMRNLAQRSQRVVSPGPRDVRVVWSPSGDRLVYESVAGKGNGRILSVRLGSDETPKLLSRGREPSFTPDGAWIVYTQPTQGRWRLWRMRPDGSGKLPLPGWQQGDERQPTVSPDGRFVAYVIENEDRRTLWIREMGGTARRRVLDLGDGSFPVW